MEHISTRLIPLIEDLLENSNLNNEMKKISKSIDELAAHLQRKGYDSLFTMSDGGAKKLDDQLKAHLANAIRNPLLKLLPVKVETVTGLPDKEGFYAKCSFSIDYNSRSGAHVTHMFIDLLNRDIGSDHISAAFRVDSRKDIPTKNQANKIVGYLPKRRKKRKRLKF